MRLQRVPAEREYERNSELKRKDVAALTEWLQKQPHLPNISELEVILFLHSCFYSQEAAKTTIDNYYTVRTHCPEFFTNRTPDAVLKTTEVGLYNTLKITTDEHYRVIFCRLHDPDPSKYVYSDNLKLFTMVMDLWLLQDGTAPGHVIVFDMQGINLGHLAKLGIMTMKKYLFYLQEAMPVRLKGLHFLHVVPFMDKILALMKPFMKKELMDVLHLHTDGMDSLYKFVPQRCLPKELGGDSPSLKEMHDNMKKTIIENEDYFKDEEKQRVVESKRPGKAKNAGDLFGVEGSFKKLDID